MSYSIKASGKKLLSDAAVLIKDAGIFIARLGTGIFCAVKSSLADKKTEETVRCDNENDR